MPNTQHLLPGFASWVAELAALTEKFHMKSLVTTRIPERLSLIEREAIARIREDHSAPQQPDGTNELPFELTRTRQGCRLRNQ